jgi:capsid protein
VTGSSTIILNEGEAFNQFATERPSLNMQEFWKQLTQKVCSGIGIPYVLLYPESMQGTVYRGALDMSAVWFRTRHSVIAAAAQEIWEYVISWAIENPEQSGLGGAPDDWRNTSIRAPRSPNVDVGRNSAAQLAELAAGMTSPDEIYGPRGLDAYEEARKKAEWIKNIRDIATEYGVDPSEIAEGVKPAGAAALPEPRVFAA